MAAVIKPTALESGIDKIVREFVQINFEATQEALEEASQEMAKILAEHTTSRTGFMKRSWKTKYYKNVKFIYNERGAQGVDKGIPLANLAEYSRRGPRPFIQQTWERNKAQIAESVKRKLELKLKNK